MSEETDRNELLRALRQYRHNTDNSPDKNNPKQGFTFGYECVQVENLVDRLIEERDYQKKLAEEYKYLANHWYDRYENQLFANNQGKRNTLNPNDFANFIEDLQALKSRWLKQKEENIVSPSTGRWMLEECIKDVDHILGNYI